MRDVQHVRAIDDTVEHDNLTVADEEQIDEASDSEKDHTEEDYTAKSETDDDKEVVQPQRQQRQPVLENYVNKN